MYVHSQFYLTPTPTKTQDTTTTIPAKVYRPMKFLPKKKYYSFTDGFSVATKKSNNVSTLPSITYSIDEPLDEMLITKGNNFVKVRKNNTKQFKDNICRGVSKYPTGVITTQLQEIISALHTTVHNLNKRFKTYLQIPQFYGLPTIHKKFYHSDTQTNNFKFNVNSSKQISRPCTTTASPNIPRLPT